MRVNVMCQLDPTIGASKVALVVKNLPASAGDTRDSGSTLGSGRPPGGGHSNTLQNSCLENPLDREAWQATVHGVSKSQTTKQLTHTHTHTHKLFFKIATSFNISNNSVQGSNFPTSVPKLLIVFLIIAALLDVN